MLAESSAKWERRPSELAPPSSAGAMWREKKLGTTARARFAWIDSSASFDMALRAKLRMRSFLRATNNLPYPELAPKAHVEGRTRVRAAGIWSSVS
jgi:hypothetical protein